MVLALDFQGDQAQEGERPPKSEETSPDEFPFGHLEPFLMQLPSWLSVIPVESLG